MSESQVRALAARLWNVYRAEYHVLFGDVFVGRISFFDKVFDELQPSAQELWLKLAQEAVSELCTSKVRVC